MIIISRETTQGDPFPPGTQRIEYVSAYDNETDWLYYTPGNLERATVVYLHGSFADGAQIYTRQDVRDFWLSRILAGGHPLLSLNLRGTAYMSPAAAADLESLLAWGRKELGFSRYVLLGGSGGASSVMAYAVMRPQDVSGVVALGMCDIFSRLEYAEKSDNPVLQELARTVYSAYGGSPSELPDVYRARSVLAHPERLTMPVVLTIGECDALIPAAETRKVAQVLCWNPRFTYVEVPGGDHDSAVWVDIDLETCKLHC
jgi:pimeloyl-ACP methyl ester carboxylesterase